MRRGNTRLNRFGVRTLLLLVAVAAMVTGIWTNRANRQRRAVNVIADLGTFAYWHEWPSRDDSGGIDYSAKPPGPDWLRRVIGDDYFQTVRSVGFSANDETIKQLASLPDLTLVAIDAYHLTDEGIKELSCLKKLEDLEISHGHNLTNSSMSALERLPRLKRLNFSNTPIDHSWVEHIAKLTNLQQVSFHGTRLSVDDVTRIRALLPDTDVSRSEYPGYKPPTGIHVGWRPYSMIRGTRLDNRLQ